MCTLNFEAFSVDTATSRPSAVTSGTWLVVGPLETLSVIVEPFGWKLPADGLSPTTVSFGWSESTSFRATANPAACSSELACSNGSPITEGTPTGATPFETLIRTTVPSTTFAPAFGNWPVTWPDGLSEWISTTFGFSCTDARAAVASVACLPTTLGTTDFALPVETRIVTGLPLSVCVLADGSWS